jgi:carbamoyltransferase
MNRTEFMPFAPVVRRENSEKFFQGFEETDMLTAAFMTSTFYVTDIFAQLCPAVTHIDNTARPQIVRKDEDPFLWKLLFEWEAASGEPALINTSFNAHEEPIVCTEEDALGGLSSGMIDVLYTDALRVVQNPDHDG